MTAQLPRWLTRVAWLVVGSAAVVLLVDTVGLTASAGLFAVRPPLSTAQTAFRLVLGAGAVLSLVVFRRTIERLTLLLAVAAAGSSALYGFGLRSPALSAFRLLSHFGLHLFALVCAVTALYADARHARSRRLVTAMEPQ